MNPPLDPATLVTRDIPAADYRRFKAAAAARGVSMQALNRELIHAIAEAERLRERAEALQSYSERPDRPRLDSTHLLNGLRADRNRQKGLSA